MQHNIVLHLQTVVLWKSRQQRGNHLPNHISYQSVGEGVFICRRYPAQIHSGSRPSSPVTASSSIWRCTLWVGTYCPSLTSSFPSWENQVEYSQHGSLFSAPFANDAIQGFSGQTRPRWGSQRGQKSLRWVIFLKNAAIEFSSCLCFVICLKNSPPPFLSPDAWH